MWDGAKQTLSCFLAIAKALVASSQSFRLFARMPKTCQVIWLVISFFTAVRAIASASSSFGAEEAVIGKGRFEWIVSALSARVSAGDDVQKDDNDNFSTRSAQKAYHHE